MLAERMREQTGRPVQVVNLSRSGATIRDLLSMQLPRLRELRPDVVTVAIGGNDVRSYERARFSADADELTAALPPGTHIADVPDFMHGRWETGLRKRAGSSLQAPVPVSCASCASTTGSATEVLARCSPILPQTGLTPTTAVIASGRTRSGAC